MHHHHEPPEPHTLPNATEHTIRTIGLYFIRETDIPPEHRQNIEQYLTEQIHTTNGDWFEFSQDGQWINVIITRETKLLAPEYHPAIQGDYYYQIQEMKAKYGQLPNIEFYMMENAL